MNPQLTPNPYGLAILHGLQSKQMYAGTARPNKVRRRRVANRIARASRRQNRGR